MGALLTLLANSSAAPIPVLPPDAVSDLSGTAGDTDAVMTWTAPDDNGSPITDYIVQYREKP